MTHIKKLVLAGAFCALSAFATDANAIIVEQNIVVGNPGYYVEPVYYGGYYRYVPVRGHKYIHRHRNWQYWHDRRDRHDHDRGRHRGWDRGRGHDHH